MSRTITALFDTRADAEAGAERLRQAGVEAAHVNVHDQTTHGTTGDKTGSITGDTATSHDSGMWASIKNVFVPHEDRHVYDEGVRRGGFLLTADVDDDKTPAAVKALEDANTVDLDARSDEWRSQGWDQPATAEAVEGADEGILYGTRESGVGGGRYRSYVSGS